MNKREVETLLGFWYKREQNGRVPIAFQFKAYKDRSTGDVVPVIRNKRMVGRSKGAKRSGKNVKRLQQADPVEGSETESIPPGAVADGPASMIPTGSQDRSRKLHGKRKAAADADEDADGESDDATQGKKQRLVKARDIGEEETSQGIDEENFSTGRGRGLNENEVSDEMQKGVDHDIGTGRRHRQGPPGIRMSEQDSKTVRTRSESNQVYMPVQTRAAAQRAAKQK